MSELKVVHYLNQFFAGIGGEEAAGHELELMEAAVGPGRLLQQELGDGARISATLVCGDNYFHDNREQVIEKLQQLLQEQAPDLVVAGPAFNAGRYGLACAEVCTQAAGLGQLALTGLYPEAPAVEVYRGRIVAVPTSDSAGSMGQAMQDIGRLAGKLLAGEPLGPAALEGILPRGFRANWVEDTLPAQRAVAMLMAKLSGDAFQSEIPLPEAAEVVKPAAAIADLAQATVALVTEGGLVPLDNPDGIETSSATRWARYPLDELEQKGSNGFHSIHAGYDAHWVNENPNRMVPLDAARQLAQDGVIGSLHQYYYVTVGTGTSVTHAARIGGEIAAQLINEGVHAAIVTST
jgi:glycine reductase